MSTYPAKLAVVMPDFVTIDGDERRGDPRRLVFLNGFSIFKVEQRGRGFHFGEIRQVDETHIGGASLLMALAAELDEDTSLAGYRLDRVVGSLVQVPCDDPRDAECKPALLRLQAALSNDVQDAHWYNRDRLDRWRTSPATMIYRPSGTVKIVRLIPTCSSASCQRGLRRPGSPSQTSC